MFQTKIENQQLYYRISENHGWVLEADKPYKSDEEAGKRADFLSRRVALGGQIVYMWHPRKKTVYVFHTAIKQLGFADRNAQAKGFLSCYEICRRDATVLDNLDFLTGSRAKWYEYDNINTLIQDEAQFAPEYAETLRQKTAHLKPQPKQNNLFNQHLQP